MSKIGEYIHLTAAGYDKYGIYRAGKRKREPFNFEEAKNTELDKIKGKLKNNLNVSKTEKTLQNFFTNTQKGKITPDMKKIINAVSRRMNKQFEKLGTIDFKTGDVTMTEELKKMSIGKIKELSEKNGGKVDYRKIENKIQKLQAIQQELLGKSNTNAEELQERIDEIQSSYNEIKNIVTDPEVVPPELQKENFEKTKNLIDQINEAIATYAAMPAIYLQKGEFFEYLVPYILGVANGQSIAAITKSLSKVKVGGKGDDVKINSEFFGLDKDENETEKIQFDKDVLTVKKSQGKIDVYVNIEGEEVGASLKNVNLQRAHANIHTVTGSNLLFFLQDVQPDFVNHYINLNASHQGKLSKETVDLRKTSRTAIGKVIAAKAITGANYGRKTADIFIVNDNKTGNIRIVTMYKLVEAIGNITSFTEAPTQVGGKAINDQNLFSENKMDPDDKTGITRISKLLSSLHKIKVSASIKESLLNKAYGGKKA